MHLVDNALLLIEEKATYVIAGMEQSGGRSAVRAPSLRVSLKPYVLYQPENRYLGSFPGLQITVYIGVSGRFI